MKVSAKKLVALLLITQPGLFCFSALAEDSPKDISSLDSFYEKSGFCKEKSKSKKTGIQKAFIDFAREEVCKINLLIEKVENSNEFCLDLKEIDASDCFSKSIEKIHQKQPFSTGGISHFSLQQIKLIMKERKTNMKLGKVQKAVSTAASKKILALNIQAQKMLGTRASVKSILGKENLEIKEVEDESAKKLCAGFKKSGHKIIKGADPEILNELSDEKVQFESLPDCS